MEIAIAVLLVIVALAVAYRVNSKHVKPDVDYNDAQRSLATDSREDEVKWL